MARPGVTYQDIASAAIELKGQGKGITIENIRNLLGTGSIGTINKYLRQWRDAQNATQQLAVKENLPESLVAIVKGLWESVLTQAQEQFTVVEDAYKTETEDLREAVEKYKNNNQRWQKLFYEWQQEKAALANEKLTLEQAIDFIQKEQATLLSKQDSYLQQLEEKQNRIDELHRLHKQTQENLEHYRESTREQRLLMQHQFDQQKLELLAEVKRVNENSEVNKEKAFHAMQNLQVLNQNNEHLQMVNTENQTEIKHLKQRLVELEKESNENRSWQPRFLEIKTALENTVAEWQAGQSEIKVLAQQLQDQKLLLDEIRDQNKLLNSDKWALAQEKSKLEGELKQMHRLLPV